jgi:putative endopeptidase
MALTKGLLLAALATAVPLALAAQTQQPPELKSIDLGAIDRAANPCNDFYQYACGNWMKNNPIPPDQSRWARFNELAERNRAVLRGILEKAADTASPQPSTRDGVVRHGTTAARTPDLQKIADLYASCMDEKTIEANGISPIKPDLDRIAGLKSKSDLAAELAHLHSQGVWAFFMIYQAAEKGR